MIGNLELAELHLGLAEKIFEDSGKEDHVRECELFRTRGLIAMGKGKFGEAVDFLLRSLQFVEKYHLKSPCIEFTHRIDLAKALIMHSQLSNAQNQLKLAEELRVRIIA